MAFDVSVAQHDDWTHKTHTDIRLTRIRSTLISESLRHLCQPGIDISTESCANKRSEHVINCVLNVAHVQHYSLVWKFLQQPNTRINAMQRMCDRVTATQEDAQATENGKKNQPTNQLTSYEQWILIMKMTKSVRRFYILSCFTIIHVGQRNFNIYHHLLIRLVTPLFLFLCCRCSAALETKYLRELMLHL